MPKLDIALRIADHDYEYRSVLRDISTRRYRNIILDLNPPEAQIVLKMALQLGMINSTYHYVLTTLDIETMNLEDFKYNRANITGLRLIKTESQFYKSISVNLTNYNYPNSNLHSRKQLSNSDKSRLFLWTKNALLFDSIYLLSLAVREAEKTLNLQDSSISCLENKPFIHGTMLSTFIEKVENFFIISTNQYKI